MKVSELKQIIREEIQKAMTGNEDYVYTMSGQLENMEGDAPLVAVKFTATKDMNGNSVEIVDIMDAETKQSVMGNYDSMEIESFKRAMEGDDYIDWNEFDPGYDSTSEPVAGDEISMREIPDFFK